MNHFVDYIAEGRDNALGKAFYIVHTSFELYFQSSLLAHAIIISADTTPDGEGRGSTERISFW